MSLWAIVPVKPLRRGKSRLAQVLSEDERNLLNYTMLGHTLQVLKGMREIQQVLVISRDPGALALARNLQARTVQEDGNSDNLNQALQRATVVAQLSGAQSVLILPADLPLLDTESLDIFLKLGQNAPVVAIAPDRHCEGTNGLLIHPAGLLTYQFGVHSFEKHKQQAEGFGVRVEVCELPALGLDLDVPEDLRLLQSMEGAPLGQQQPE